MSGWYSESFAAALLGGRRARSMDKPLPSE
jgi:hypothetical protein